MWGPVLKKAWANEMGSYVNTNYRYSSTAIRALLDVPVFEYNLHDMVSVMAKQDKKEICAFKKPADVADYIIMTCGDDDKDNKYGINYCRCLSIKIRVTNSYIVDSQYQPSIKMATL